MIHKQHVDKQQRHRTVGKQPYTRWGGLARYIMVRCVVEAVTYHFPKECNAKDIDGMVARVRLMITHGLPPQSNQRNQQTNDVGRHASASSSSSSSSSSSASSAASNNDHDDDYWRNAFGLDKFVATNQAIHFVVELRNTDNDNFMVSCNVSTHTDVVYHHPYTNMGQS